MTLKELKQAVGIPKENIHYKVLRKSEDVFLRVQTESEAWITVLESGYIIYQTGERLTCFPITKCGIIPIPSAMAAPLSFQKRSLISATG